VTDISSCFESGDVFFILWCQLLTITTVHNTVKAAKSVCVV
jgi:hypothetical protein